MEWSTATVVVAGDLNLEPNTVTLAVDPNQQRNTTVGDDLRPEQNTTTVAGSPRLERNTATAAEALKASTVAKKQMRGTRTEPARCPTATGGAQGTSTGGHHRHITTRMGASRAALANSAASH